MLMHHYSHVCHACHCSGQARNKMKERSHNTFSIIQIQRIKIQIPYISEQQLKQGQDRF